MFTLVGLDGGLLPAPVANVAEILLAPAKRAEVLVTGTQSAATRTTLYALPYDRGALMAPGMGSVAAQQPTALLTLAYRFGAVLTPPLPNTLRTIAMLDSPGALKRVVLSERMSGMMGIEFLINGTAFDPGRVDLLSRAGEVEIWEIVNATRMDHPFHVHGTQFRVLDRSRGGHAVADPLLALKNTVNTRAGETVRIKIVQGTRGKRMFHCHILEHEDLGMMEVLEVV